MSETLKRASNKTKEKGPAIQSEQTALDLLDKPRVNSHPLTQKALSELRQELAEELEDR
jgi:hypothetical protein